MLSKRNQILHFLGGKYIEQQIEQNRTVWEQFVQCLAYRTCTRPLVILTVLGEITGRESFRVDLPNQRGFLQWGFSEWLAAPASWMCPWYSYMVLSLALCWYCLEILNNFWVRGPTFLFCSGPCKLCSWSWWLALAWGSWSPSYSKLPPPLSSTLWVHVGFPFCYMLWPERHQEAVP